MKATDINPPSGEYDCTDPQSVGLRFNALYEAVTQFPPPPLTMLRVELNTAGHNIDNVLPGGTNIPDPKRVAQLVADPTNADRLYIFYHDTKTSTGADSTDVNVYMHKLTKGLSGWSIGPRIQVNADTNNESDQFMPAPTVDGTGRIHVIYYDDRNFTDNPNDPFVDQQPDATTNARFDVFYAYSLDQGETWTRIQLLKSPPEEPALDFSVQSFAGGIREYIGIASSGDTVWAAFTGTWSQETGHKSLIWVSRIDW